MATEEALNDIVRARQRAAPVGWSANPGWRAVALSVGYVAFYLMLDRLSFVGALHDIGITPWSPSTGLAMALLVIKGLRYAPLVLAAELLSSATLPMASPSALPVCLASLVVVVGYAGAAAILRYAGLQAGIRRSSDVVMLITVAIISSGLVANGFVATYAAAGIVPWSGFAKAEFHFWIGDAIGIVVLVPPLLLLYERMKQRTPPGHGMAALQFVEVAAQGASVIAALTAVFSGMGSDHPLGLFYVLFLPLIWIATRHGLPAASWAVLTIQIGLIAGVEIQGHSESTLRAFQLFMLALAATGLMLGAVVSERRRLGLALADSEGRRTAILNTARDGVLTIDAQGSIQSINPAVERLFSRPNHRLIGHPARVSLAGEMAAGLAHELSQPLTAITAYGRGCLRLLTAPMNEPELLHEGITEVVQQAERAGDVLDRLREFVRGGENRRALTEVGPLIDGAVSLIRMEATQQQVEIEARVTPGLPAVLADRVQIQQVLLNLLRNAMEAMEAANSKPRSVIVEARRNSKHAIEISVADSGPGVAAEVEDTIFEPFTTTKPLGMGMGLSISRAIIESHGGSLRMSRGIRSDAIFFFDLPTAETQASTDAG